MELTQTCNAESMTYRDTPKRNKIRSMLGVAAREAIRMNNPDYGPPAEIDYYMKSRWIAYG